jgi:hypothetical protein
MRGHFGHEVEWSVTAGTVYTLSLVMLLVSACHTQVSLASSSPIAQRVPRVLAWQAAVFAVVHVLELVYIVIHNVAYVSQCVCL